MADNWRLRNARNHGVARGRDVNNNDIVEDSESDTETASETESDIDPDRDIDAELQSAWERICVNMVRLGYRIDRQNERYGPRAGANPNRSPHHRHVRRRPG